MALISLRNNKSSHLSNNILASLLLIFAVINSRTLFLRVTTIELTPEHFSYFFIIGLLAFLTGPLLYFYIKSLLAPNYSLHKRDLIHSLPFIIAVIFAIFHFHRYISFFPPILQRRGFFAVLIFTQKLAYFIALFFIIRSYGLTIKSFFSYIGSSKLAWVRFFISGYIFIWLANSLINFVVLVLDNLTWYPYIKNLYTLTAFLFFNGIIYIALRRPETFRQTQKYQSSILNNSDKEVYRVKLISLMNQEKLYLNPSITINEIAQKLDIHPIYVSQIINETFQQNFRDFVNKYRIEECKRLLTQEDHHLNIMGIALDSGFNSKSAFNRAFKRHTGITPKEFKKSVSSITSS